MHVYKKITLFFLLTGCINVLNAQEDAFQKSVIHDAVAVKGTNTETFSIYFPALYDASKLSAIVFIFDPGGMGKRGIQPFVKSAEKYNYILVCSNDSRNGPYERNFDVADRLFNHIFTTYSIDPKQIYTAGFSGGSRLANTIAVLTKQIQGVIACGAGFSTYPGHVPAKEAYSYAGLVGDTDMNYREMTNNITWFNKSKVDNELFYFSGNHRWPSQDQVERVFDWLQIQAYKKGIRLKNESIIKQAYLRNYREADSLEKAGLLYSSVFEFERILRNYNATLRLDSIQLKIKALKKNKKYAEQLKIQKRIATEEERIVIKFRERFNNDLKKGKSTDNFKWWKKELNRLDSDYVNAEDIYLKQMGERIRFLLFAMAIETSNGLIGANKFKKALYCDQFLAIQRPNEAFPYYRLAQNYARLLDEANFILNLEKVLQLGFTDKERLKKTKEFAPFIDSEAFIALLNRY